jgi:hypothetical protein
MRSYTRPAFITWDDEEDYDHPEVLELEQRIDHARDWFEEVCEILYGKKEFDSTDLENALDELGSHLSCRIPNNDLQVTYKEKSI